MGKRFITTPERVARIEGHQEGLQEGMTEMLIRALRRRFGAVPPAVIAKIQRAGIDKLLSWEEKIATANSVTEVIG